MTSVPPGIPAVLDRGLSERPDAVAVQARSGSLTYRQLDTAASHAAGALWECGVRPGNRIAACLPNDLDVVVAFHAAMRIGAIWAGIGSALALTEKVQLIRHSGPRVILAPPELARELQAEPAASSARIVAVGPTTPDDWHDLLDAELRAPRIDIDPHAPAAIAYTSGTTGAPKGVVHSQHNLLFPGAVVVAERGYGPQLRKGDCLPLTILNLIVLSTLLTAQAGGCCVVMDRRDAAGVAEWIRTARINVFNGVPTQLWDLVRDPGIRAADLATLHDVWCGGADCPDELRAAFAAKFSHRLRATYGLTEAPAIVSMDPAGTQWRTRSSGQVLPHLSVAVVDDDGKPAPKGGVGELCVTASPSGPWANQWTPLLGFWHGDGVTPGPPGPLRTGDLGTVDDDGWLSVTDRRKLLIVRGGANVYPAEVERVLLAYPGVAGAAVFGIADARLGERVAALIEASPGTPRPSTPELQNHCAEYLARYKVPEVWRIVDALPRNAMGKIVRTELGRLLESNASV
jgi:long-chain acyl-CoA synthetase